MPLPDERIHEIIAEVEAAQKAERLRCSLCRCCGKPLERFYAVPTECIACITGETFN